MEEMFAGLAVVAGLLLVVVLALAVLTIIANWKLFEKAGEPGWSAIIPFYNSYQMAKIGTGNETICWVYVSLSILNTVLGNIESDNGAFNAIALLVSLASLVISCYVYYKYTESFGQSTGMCILAIFFAPIIYMIMAFSSSTEYVGPNGVPRFKSFNSNNSYGGNEYNNSYDYSSYHNNNNDGFLK
ncbi:MAG: hypothetical protein IKV85_01860 [Ruminococcus sp.]|nr:hypothetical protein [Ruminococcus sp.]